MNIRFLAVSLLFTSSTLFHSGHASEKVDARSRDLIVVMNLSRLAKFKLNYQIEEKRAARKVMRDLGAHYRMIHFYTGRRAGKTSLLQAISNAEWNPDVRAVDVLIYLHGLPGRIGFVDTGYISMDTVRDEILALPGPDGGPPKKLRALYSDACYGESHIRDWIDAGFKVASGALEVDTNWSADLRKFARAWRSGASFETGIGKANRVWSTKFTDWIIKDGNSLKFWEGAGDFRIDQPVD